LVTGKEKQLSACIHCVDGGRKKGKKGKESKDFDIDISSDVCVLLELTLG
jgi:hypothetical protein